MRRHTRRERDLRPGRPECGYDGRVNGPGRGRFSTCICAAAVVAALAGSACRRPPPEPITFQERAIVIENQTAEEWQNVEVWVNDHYRVTKSKMAPGERFAIPLNAFVAGFGQRFDQVRQPLRGVEVTASAPGGRPVKLVWGTGRRR